ncbi:replication-relaxation family protein [Embleya sp. NPDC005575]|uniref:replication-relaxation family protein n=1 Tax=Embleya sp. NPDC005575 TaxID=3156892 RepID=UPI0033B3B0F2
MSGDDVATSRIQKLSARLTDRDRLILRTLATHRLLTTHQITELAFDSPVTARHRMQQLEGMQAVDRFRPRADRGSHPSHFVLAPAGAAAVAVEAGQDTKPAIRQARRDRELGMKSPRGLAHLIGVNGFHTALEAHARTHPDTSVERWLSEREMPAPGFYGGGVRPDAVVTWRQGRTRATLAIEYDTGTERLARLVDKIGAYDTLLDAWKRGMDAYVAQDLFGTEHPVVLFVFTSPRREIEARAALNRTHTTVPIATGVRPPDTSPTEPLWLPLGARPPRLRPARLGAGVPGAPSPIETGTTRGPGRARPTALAADAGFEDDESDLW